MPLQVWQVKEKAKLEKSGAHLAELALNKRTSNEAFYRAAVYEAVNIHQRKRARERRAREAGIRTHGDGDGDGDDRDVDQRSALGDGSLLPDAPRRQSQRSAPGNRKKKKNNKRSGGVEVLNKDTIDPQTVKRLGKQQVDDILAICKRHKWLVDTAKAGINTKLDPVWEARLSTHKLALQRKEILRERRFAKQSRTLSENNKKSRSSGYGVKSKKRASRKKKKGGLGPASSTSSDNTASTMSTSTSNTAATPQRKTELQQKRLPTRYIRDELPEFEFPLTLKNYNTRRVVQGWEHGAKKLDWLIRTAVSALDTSEPESRRRLREDRERKARMARATGLGDPDDVRPGEFGLSFSEKEHWRMHLDQLHQLIETAPVRISAKIDPHSWSDAVEQLWQMCRKAEAKIDNDWGVHGP
eukprot:g4795.t1